MWKVAKVYAYYGMRYFLYVIMKINFNRRWSFLYLFRTLQQAGFVNLRAIKIFLLKVAYLFNNQ